MTAACNKWSGLFSVGEDFDDQDLLEADWTHTLKPTSSTGSTAAPAASLLRELPTSHSHNALQGSDVVSANCKEHRTDPGSLTPHAFTESTAKILRSLSNPSSCTSTASLRAPLGFASSTSSEQPLSVQSNPPPVVCGAPKRQPAPQDDFDDWDLDLEDLNESETLWTSKIQSSSDNVSPSKRLRPSSTAHFTPAASSPAFAPPNSFTTPRPSTIAPRCNSAPFSRTVSVGRFSSPVTPRPVKATSQCQSWAGTPRTPELQPKSLFQAVSPAPSPALTPHRHLHTPVLTNHLVQLVSAANKTPQRPKRDSVASKTRRFPGPAGLLPQQVSGRSLEDIVVTVPQTPAHGAVARVQSEGPSSQPSEEEEFSGGAWAAMKAEMGLDERNLSCFLRSYSIVMVLRKAALRQLVKNKVPNMAVVLKSIVHTHSDAKAVFKDPTGEMQGTVHRRLLEERQPELKPGAVLLLKQVGVFSPSHRNHYLNVTPSNLLRIYSPDGVLHTAYQRSQSTVGAVGLMNSDTFRPVGVPVSQMDLLYDDDDDEDEAEQEKGQGVAQANPTAHSSTLQPTPGPEQSEDALWGTDGLDELLVELPVDSYSS